MPIDYVKKAAELGYSEIGISDHGPLPAGWAHLRMDRDEFENIYLPAIQSAKLKFQDKIKIYSGLEIEYHEDFDYYYPKLLKEVDYLILGQHISMFGNEVHDLYRFMNDETVINYRKLVVAGLKTHCFRILAHPDVFMYRYTVWNDLAAQISKEIIEAAIENDVILEINCNGIRRGPIFNQDGELTYIYPRIEFWRLVSQYPNVKVIIGEDNHSPRLTGDESVGVARDFAESLGIKLMDRLFGEKR